MKTKYAVLNDKLFSGDVAELLLAEGVGPLYTSVQIILNSVLDPDFIHLKDLYIKATEANIIHSFTNSFILEMLAKLISNNHSNSEKIIVKIIMGNKTFLHIYFI